MKKILTICLLGILLATGVSAASDWVQDATTCPATDATNYPGQSCSPVDICGDSSGTAQCYDTTGVSLPAGDSSPSITDWSGTYNGGYVLNCYATADGSAPFCDNSGAWWCDRNSTCYTTNHKTTVCDGGALTYTCGACRSAYQDCDATPAICEVQTGVTAQDKSNTVYAAACGYACSSGYQACEGDTAPVEGCVYETGVTTCTTGGGEPGTWEAGCTCTALPQEDFVTNTLASGYGNYLLYGEQDNDDGWLMNLSGASTQGLFRVDSFGNASTSASMYADEFCINTTTPDCISAWPTGGGNPFDQWLDTTSTPLFNSVTTTDTLYVGGDAFIGGATEYISFVKEPYDANPAFGNIVYMKGRSLNAVGGISGIAMDNGLTIRAIPSSPSLAFTSTTDSSYTITANFEDDRLEFGSAGLYDFDDDINVANDHGYYLNGISIAYGDTAKSNYFFGNSGNTTMSGNNNTAVGLDALSAVTTGYKNAALGVRALRDNTTGYQNTAIGYTSMLLNTTGNSNIAFGANSLNVLLNGSGNNALGANSLTNLTSGSANTANGNGSLREMTSGQYNAGIGYRAGIGDESNQDYHSTLDNGMVFLGAFASRDNTIASTTPMASSTAIGYNAKVGCNSCMALGGSGDDAVRVGVGTSTPWAGYELAVVGDTVVTGDTFTLGSSTTTGSIVMGDDSEYLRLEFLDWGILGKVPFFTGLGWSTLGGEAVVGINGLIALRDNDSELVPNPGIEFYNSANTSFGYIRGMEPDGKIAIGGTDAGITLEDDVTCDVDLTVTGSATTTNLYASDIITADSFFLNGTIGMEQQIAQSFWAFKYEDSAGVGANTGMYFDALGGSLDVKYLNNNIWSIANIATGAMKYGNALDVSMTFAPNSGQGIGVFTWMEDEDYFQFADDVVFDLNATTTGNQYIGKSLTVGGNNATSTVEIGDDTASGKGGCIKIRDHDDAGWTYCSTLNGILSCSTNSCE